MTNLNDYNPTTADWRNTLRQNQQRTFIVIGLFFAIYASVGILIDLYIYSNQYRQASLEQIFQALLHLQLIPYATLIMLGIALISLWVSYIFYDRLMLMGTDYHEISPQTAQSVAEQQLYNVVDEMRLAAGLRFMPKVYIIQADYMNAFASGWSEKSAMVAITAGLMQKLNRDELQAVMAHEISHIRHMDIKLTLTASLLANFTVMVLDIFFYNAIFSSRDNDDNRSRNTIATIIILLRYVLPVINVVLLLYLSRKRELMADAGCVELMRNNLPLANALIKISTDYTKNSDQYNAQLANTPNENVRREAYLFDPTQAGISSLNSISDLFSTHPSLEERLKALGFNPKH